MKKILKALLILIGMIAMLFVLAVIVNLSVFDEELLPEVQAIKDIKAKPYQADNAYPALIAMNYYPDESYKTATKKIRNLLNRNITDSDKDFLSETDNKSLKTYEINGSNLIEYTRCHTRKEKNCVKKYVNKLRDQPITDQNTTTLLERYAELINYQYFSEPTQLDFFGPLPAYGPVMSAQRVLLLKQWSESKSDFISLISKDIRFWSMILKNNNLLITKMVAIAALHNDIQILGYVIQSSELNNNQLLGIQRQLSGLNDDEKDLLSTIQFEIKYAMSSFYNILDQSNNYIDRLFYHPLYQPQSTINKYYLANIKLATQLNNLDSPAFYQAYQTEEWPYKPEFKSPLSLYNPSGKLLVKLGAGAYQDYFARIHDLDAMLALLNLRIELALNNDQHITSVINNSSHKNTYTNKPFDYDAEAQTIGFNCLDKTSVCEIAL